MTTPAVTALRKAFPSAFISYVVEEPYKDLVEGNPNLDKIYVIEKKQRLKGFLRLIQQIRREKHDVVLDFHGGPRASFITLFSRAKLKAGYRIKYRNLIYDIKLPRRPKSGHFHSVENHMNLVKSLGVNIDPIPPLFVPQATESEVEKIEKFIKESRLEGRKIITIHISAGNEFRDWGVEYWVKLADLLSRHSEVRIVLTGAEEDAKAGEEIVSKSKALVFSSVGRLKLRELRELISRSLLFIGPDSGPMHIAASTSTPIVALFGPTLPAHFAPWQAKAIIIEKDFKCRPCKQRHCIYEDFRCLRTIIPEEVFQACRRFI